MLTTRESPQPVQRSTRSGIAPEPYVEEPEPEQDRLSDGWSHMADPGTGYYPYDRDRAPYARVGSRRPTVEISVATAEPVVDPYYPRPTYTPRPTYSNPFAPVNSPWQPPPWQPPLRASSTWPTTPPYQPPTIHVQPNYPIYQNNYPQTQRAQGTEYWGYDNRTPQYIAPVPAAPAPRPRAHHRRRQVVEADLVILDDKLKRSLTRKIKRAVRRAVPRESQRRVDQQQRDSHKLLKELLRIRGGDDTQSMASQISQLSTDNVDRILDIYDHILERVGDRTRTGMLMLENGSRNGHDAPAAPSMTPEDVKVMFSSVVKDVLATHRTESRHRRSSRRAHSNNGARRSSRERRSTSAPWSAYSDESDVSSVASSQRSEADTRGSSVGSRSRTGKGLSNNRRMSSREEQKRGKESGQSSRKSTSNKTRSRPNGEGADERKRDAGRSSIRHAGPEGSPVSKTVGFDLDKHSRRSSKRKKQARVSAEREGDGTNDDDDDDNDDDDNDDDDKSNQDDRIDDTGESEGD